MEKYLDCMTIEPWMSGTLKKTKHIKIVD